MVGINNKVRVRAYCIAFSFVILLLPVGLMAQERSTIQYPLGHTGFYENKGQIVDQNYVPNPAVKYLLCTPGFNVQLRQTGFSYDTYTDSVVSSQSPVVSPKILCLKSKETPPNFTRHYHRVDIELQGCNPNPTISTNGKSEAYYNYFTAGTPQGGISDVHFYQKVIYKNIYPNIDLEFFIRNSGNDTSSPKGEGQEGVGESRVGGTGTVEYNFIVHPGGNPDNIKLQYKGANKIKLDDGELKINVAAGDFSENIPTSYLKDTKQPVQVNYEDLGYNIYGFSIHYSPRNIHNSTSDLIIDPTPSLAWATYYGDSSINHGNGITLDASKNVYITGSTSAASGIATSGVYQTTYGGNYNAFVAKFNSTGSALDWGTYFGGTGPSFGYGIAIDPSNEVYITGYTSSSSGITTSAAYQTTYFGQCAYIAKFNKTGTTLIRGTYFGESYGGAYAIALDKTCKVYITGNNVNSVGMTTSGAYQSTASGFNAYAAKFDSTLSTLIWGTFYGIAGTTNYGEGITVDTSGDVYITGNTNSASGMATSGAYQTTDGGGSSDVFIAKFNPNLTGTAQLVWGTYYGGSGSDGGTGIALDKHNNIYITGYTSSSSGIATTGTHQTTYGNDTDAFVAKFNPSLTGTAQLVWGTYYGGSGLDESTGIVLDTNTNIYITGYTGSSSGIATSGVYQAAYGGGTSDAFIAKFNSTGTSLLWGTYFGGAGEDQGFAIVLDKSFNAYITGLTNSSSDIVTTGAYLTTYKSVLTTAAFIAEFNNTATVPLPIDLTSFTATYLEQTNAVLTDWVVATQLNNKEFVVEKTTDGTDYKEVATVPGAGTTPFSKSYSALDINPVPGVSYYRLKQIDVDGNETVFDPVPVFIGNYQSSSVNLYPNPVSSEATLIYISSGNTPLSIEIMDMTGRIVSSFTINNVQIGENNLTINTSALSKGIYFLRATEAERVYHLKFMKI